MIIAGGRVPVFLLISAILVNAVRSDGSSSMFPVSVSTPTSITKLNSETTLEFESSTSDTTENNDHQEELQCTVEKTTDVVTCDACVYKYHWDLNGENTTLKLNAEGCEQTTVQLAKCPEKEGEKKPKPTLFRYQDLEKKYLKVCCYETDCGGDFDFPFEAIRGEKTDEQYPFWVLWGLIAALGVLGFAGLVYYPFRDFLKIGKFEDQPDDVFHELQPELLGEAPPIIAVQTSIVVSGKLSLTETTVLITLIAYQAPSDEVNEKAKMMMLKQPQIVQASGNGHNIVKAMRCRAPSLTSVLFRLIEHGPYMFNFSAVELIELFDEGMDVFQGDPNMVELKPPVTIIGDIRGGYADLHRWLFLSGWPPRTKILFLGNVIDSSTQGSLETFALIVSLKIAFPNDVFLLRGSAESRPFVPSTRFPPKVSQAIANSVGRACSQLPFSAVIGGSLLAVPSGICPSIQSLDELRDIQRPVTLEDMTSIQKRLVFSRPCAQLRMYRPNANSRGDSFGSQAVEDTCRKLGVHAIVRGGSACPYGFFGCWKQRFLSLWSAPGKGSTMGAMLQVDQDSSANLNITPVLMKQQTKQTPTRSIRKTA